MNGLTVAPDAAMPGHDAAVAADRHAARRPGTPTRARRAAKPAATAGAMTPRRCRCSVLGMRWVAAIQALERARPMPPAPPSSIREPVISAPLAPTTTMPPDRPSCSAFSTARRTRRPGGLEVEVFDAHHAPTML